MNLKSKLKISGVYVLDILVNVIFLFIFVFIIREFVVAPFQVYGPSMCNTLNDYDGECQNGYGEYIILNKFGYIFGEPQRLDIVVFKPPNNDEIFYIKRIIGMPGDNVMIKNGTVYVNKKELNEYYLSETNLGETKTYTKNEFDVPEGEYLLLGDNRNQSSDSRTCFSDTKHGCKDKEATPYLSLERIEGKAWVVLWPFNYARILDKPNQVLAEK